MEEQIASIAEKELGDSPERIKETGDGLVHNTYKVVIDGEKYILQVTDKGDTDSLSNGFNIYILLSDSKIPVPKPVTGVEVYADMAYTIVEKLEGENCSKNITREKVRQAGRYLAEIHSFKSFDSTGWISFNEGEVEDTGFEDENLKNRKKQQMLEDAEKFELNGQKELARKIRKFHDKRMDEYPENFETVLCHNDYSPDNILFKDGELNGVIDWDYAYSGPAQRDLVKSALSFRMEKGGAAWNVKETFYNGYREIRDPGTDFQENESIYLVETLTRILASLHDLDAWEENGGPEHVSELKELIEENI